MKRQIITTGDGSKTIQIEDWNEQYHSIHGAIQEANHVFIKTGFDYVTANSKVDKIAILEIGFGTGLNAIITLLKTIKDQITVDYVGVEAYPVILSEIEQLNYPELLEDELASEKFKAMHNCPWEIQTEISDNFQLTKYQKRFEAISNSNQFNLIYFDAFGARIQPELWTEAIFQKMYRALKPHGVLVTYAAKGSVRRAMQAVGFNVERLPGPPGKREMLRATKIFSE
ncbi:tRNA (5-methylaminomethyl-2-thiouridine)(34)-methyltransferase MnmD [Bizionia myxarmorum]|uniref:tRNA (5-methylaminomethyl-2-thiouridine)(34)-methyltransferase MnmD n=1 Tax=Bizionia myxarmorum TaxID=291186 RepID=A0A5D0RDB4_9FLAO|nr:tRNA (5-methylaminomethyl-2-thiouridine)(34)-methyltransferase MnmD [Bizionia myxarmorum]TYB79547.1 tRNA (5-methylaminomethyl-2-thiouridine)(34)-methyltransferase MnmD [Bizionia myxarmorum]